LRGCPHQHEAVHVRSKEGTDLNYPVSSPIRYAVTTFLMVGLPASWAAATPLYTIADQGVAPISKSSSSPGSADILLGYRLTIQPGGRISTGEWGLPGPYTDPLPGELAHGAYGPDAVV